MNYENISVPGEGEVPASKRFREMRVPKRKRKTKTTVEEIEGTKKPKEKKKKGLFRRKQKDN